MKTPLIAGRDFRDSDARNIEDNESPEIRYVAIVNRKFAEHYFKGSSAVGKRLGFGDGPKARLNIDIIGVVADALYEGPREGVRRQVFIPNWGKKQHGLLRPYAVLVGRHLQ
jgi:hypothetical protein